MDQINYVPGTPVIWRCSNYYAAPGARGGEWDEPAIVVAAGATSYCRAEKGKVKILCLDGRERWVWKSDIRPA